jgi:hypothetical protein
MMHKYKDVFVRAGKTFLQAFLAVVTPSLLSESALHGTDVRRVMISASLAGIAAVVSLIQNSLKVDKS